MFRIAFYGLLMTTTENTPSTSPLDVRTFRVDVPQSAIDDLQHRLANTRFAEPAPGDAWEQGAPVGYLRDMVDHWRTSFDWRAQESRMNEFPQFLTEIDGQTIHFLHVRSPHAEATPLLLTHT